MEVVVYINNDIKKIYAELNKYSLNPPSGLEWFVSVNPITVLVDPI